MRKANGGILQDDEDFTNYLLDSVGVGTVHGTAFGTPGYFRLAYAIDRATLSEACGRIAQACAALR
jgi:aspartate aminotransferase